MHGRVEGVRIAVGEHPCQARVLKQGCNLCYFRFYGFRSEKPFLLLRTLVIIFLRLFRAVPHLRLRSHFEDKFSSCGDVFVINISLGVCLSVEGYALDVSVGVAVAFCCYGESASGNFYLSLVEQRGAEYVTSSGRLHLIESE